MTAQTEALKYAARTVEMKSNGEQREENNFKNN